jgi:CBS-domain-containing membrane protein
MCICTYVYTCRCECKQVCAPKTPLISAHRWPLSLYILLYSELLDQSKKLPVVKVRPCVTLGDCMSKFASTGVHRIFLVNDDDMPIDVLTLTDVIRLLMSPR